MARKNINKKFFNRWSPEMAYVLGYIYADGWIYERYSKTGHSSVIGICSKDKEMLEKIKKEMDSTHPLYKENRNSYISYKVYIGSAYMFKKLVSRGLNRTKSLNMKFPKVPKKYMRDFIRGYFDGDGWICYNKNTKKFQIGLCCGCKRFLYSIIKNANLKAVIKNYVKNVFRFHLTGDPAMEFCYYMYNKSNMYLDRKYNKFQEVIKCKQII